MIRNESAYQEAQNRLQQDTDVVERLRQAYAAQGLTTSELATAMEPLLSFQAQLQEEVAWYENVSQGNLPTIGRLTDIGRLLIALRIASGLTQRAFAEKLEVSEAAVSRDERNEYHGIMVERAQRILDVLEAEVTTHVVHSKVTPVDGSRLIAV